MKSYEARAVVRVLYHGREDWSGNPEIGHLERVAARCQYEDMGKSKDDKYTVALLHDAVEDGLTTFGALKAAGLTDVQHKALFLLTRVSEDGSYLDYVRNIANADGVAGEIARAVKLADNYDNCNRPCPADKQGMRAAGGRYDKARKILKGEKA